MSKRDPKLLEGDIPNSADRILDYTIKSVTLLFTDYGVPKTEVEKELCSKFNLVHFDFMQEFRKQLWHKDEFTDEITAHLNKDEFAPTALLERFLIEHLQKIMADKVLLTNYPKTQEQYISLEDLFIRSNNPIETIWYIKKSSRFKVHPKTVYNQTASEKHKEFMERIREVSKVNKWYVVELNSIEDLAQSIECGA
jgi:adenylate kinase family enzyme